MYNLQLPHITSNFLMAAMVIMVATVIVVMVNPDTRVSNRYAEV